MRTKTLQLREEDGYKHTVLCEYPFFFPTAFPPSHKKKTLSSCSGNISRRRKIVRRTELRVQFSLGEKDRFALLSIQV